MALWVADEERSLIRISKTGEEFLCPQPSCLAVGGDSIICAAADGAHVYACDTAQKLHEFPLPPGVIRSCTLPGSLYCLSSEADSVSLLCPVTGRLRLCAQTGCYPRDMTLSPCGRMLAVAGGAAGSLLILDASDLRLSRQIMLPGVVCAAAFAGAGMIVLCAVEENDVMTHVFRLSSRGVVSEILELPGLPGTLLTLPDHTLLAGSLGFLTRLRPDGRILQRIPCGLPGMMRAYPGFVLVADPLSGQVLHLPHTIGKSAAICYHGASPNDMVLI